MTLLQRFESKFEKGAGCWIWKSQISPLGRAKFQVGRKNCFASRVSYELYRGPIPPGLIVCHSCDNGLCVNPDHLWLGTYKDNSDDKIIKGRGRWENGERRYNAKLNEEKVLEIRHSSQPDSALAKKFGVSRACIWHVRHNRWKHVKGTLRLLHDLEQKEP